MDSNIKISTRSIIDEEELSFESKSIKDLILNKWDISFDINGEIFINIFKYLSAINTDIPIRFYKDRVFINLRSIDNIQYAEIEISAGDLLNYNAGFYTENIDSSLEDNKKDDIDIKKDDNDKEDSKEEQSKLVIIDMKDTIEELTSSSEKDQIITVRIDTSYYRRVEFHCTDGMIYWSRLIAPDVNTEGLEKIRNVIKKVRSDKDINKAIIVMEPSAFDKLCKIGSKASKKRDYDKVTTINVTESGMFAASGDNIKGRMLNLDYSDGISIPDVRSTDLTGYDDVYHQEHQVINMANDDSYDVLDIGKTPTDKTDSTIRPKKLLGMDIEGRESVIVNSEYLDSFTKLGGLSPITLEIRSNKPIVIEEIPYNGIRALLSVAPRISES